MKQLNCTFFKSWNLQRVMNTSENQHHSFMSQICDVFLSSSDLMHFLKMRCLEGFVVIGWLEAPPPFLLQMPPLSQHLTAPPSTHFSSLSARPVGASENSSWGKSGSGAVKMVNSFVCVCRLASCQCCTSSILNKQPITKSRFSLQSFTSRIWVSAFFIAATQYTIT